jgi:hypothetical protein
MVEFIASNGWADLIIIVLLLASIPLVARTGTYL